MRFFAPLALVVAATMPATIDAQVGAAANQIEQLGDSARTLSANDLAHALKRYSRAEQDTIVRSIIIDRRVVGGSRAAIADYPYQVALVRGIVAEPDRSQFCGGSIVGADVVLTAAHCIDNSLVRRNPARVDVIAGASKYRTGGERIAVEAVFIHPQWNATTNDYDYAILKLKKPFAIGKPVPIEAAEPTVGSDLYVSGWGATAEGGPGSDELLWADVPLIDNTTCSNAGYGDDITPRMMCAGYEMGGVDACQGDSGGPLVDGDLGARRLVGVVSWGEGCARKLRYGIYARVSEAVPWIKSLSSIQIAWQPVAPDMQLASAGR